MKKFTDSEYITIWEVCSKKEQYGDWEAVAEVLNARLHKEYTSSAYRKTYQYWSLMNDAIKNCIGNDNDAARELMIQKRELERAKIQFRDERNAWQRQNYADARVEQKLDYLEEIIKENGKQKFDICYSPITETDSRKVMIVCLSDLHIGAEYDSMWGRYNSEIAKKRLNEYLKEVIRIGKRHDVTEIAVLGIGDLVSGAIHKSIAVTNRENVIEQIMLASELITEFIGELCKYFMVNFANISGNHSRIDRKEDALKDERLDKLIGWYVKKSLSHLDNFAFLESEDTTLGVINVLNQKVWVIHGDYDSFGKGGLSNLVLAMGYKPAAIFTGHMHSAAMDDIADVKFIRSGSFGGSGDDYTVEKRLTGKPSQTVAIFGTEGVECIYPVRLH